MTTALELHDVLLRSLTGNGLAAVVLTGLVLFVLEVRHPPMMQRLEPSTTSPASVRIPTTSGPPTLSRSFIPVHANGRDGASSRVEPRPIQRCGAESAGPGGHPAVAAPMTGATNGMPASEPMNVASP
jgi:hypothetical protein